MQDGELRKGPWLDEEDDQLAAAVAVLGDGRWDALAKASGLRRSGKSCRLRWMNYLRPNLKHGNISAEEERIIIELHQKWGNRWSKIARKLPGRTDNEIKNYWRSHLKKKAIVLDKGKLQNFVDQRMQIELGALLDWQSFSCTECLISTTNTTSLRSECDTTSPCSTNDESFLSKDDISSKPLDDSSELLSLTQSPYETKLTEWMSNGPPDYGPEWISGDCTTSLWDVSLWDGE